MADEKKLTVAELLARNAKERSSSSSEGGSRRRRHRSLSEGGISVAELTGNLEKVKATPAESKHSNVSIDETAPVIPAPKAAQDTQAATGTTTDEPTKWAKDVEEGADKADAHSGPQPSTEDTRVIKRVDDKPAAAAEKEPDAGKKAEEHPDLKAGAKVAGAAGLAGASTAAVKGAEQGAEAGTETDADKAAEKAPQSGGGTAKDAADDSAADNSAPDSAELEAQRDELDECEDYDEEEQKLNPFSVILLAVIGIVLGAVVFKGFEILWDRFDRLIVAILGVVVTGVIVGIVHALRTNRDGVTMFLAAIAGLVLTFGPLLVVM